MQVIDGNPNHSGSLTLLGNKSFEMPFAAAYVLVHGDNIEHVIGAAICAVVVGCPTHRPIAAHRVKWARQAGTKRKRSLAWNGVPVERMKMQPKILRCAQDDSVEEEAGYFQRRFLAAFVMRRTINLLRMTTEL